MRTARTARLTRRQLLAAAGKAGAAVAYNRNPPGLQPGGPLNAPPAPPPAPGTPPPPRPAPPPPQSIVWIREK